MENNYLQYYLGCEVEVPNYTHMTRGVFSGICSESFFVKDENGELRFGNRKRAGN